MQKRAVRSSLLALFLVTGLGAGYFTWDTARRLSDGLAAERAIDSRLDEMAAAVAALASAQQAYVAPGQLRGEALTRASAAIQQLYDHAAALRSEARVPESVPAARAFAGTVDAAVKADDRAREQLRAGQDFLAADIVYSDARQAIDGMTDQLRQLRTTERDAVGAERQALLTRGGAAVGTWLVVWLVGLVAFARIPDSKQPTVQAEAEATPPAAAPDPIPETPPMRAVDLTEAADVCTALSSLSSSSDLPPVLARAARTLDASGAIVWIGAGEELFAATAYGYSPRVLSRMGAIPRSADNVTAEAWRTGEMRTVPSTLKSSGAIVAPLLGPGGCFGVLALEVRHGRENDRDAHAISAVFAAQLSAVVAPGPAPSVADAEKADTADTDSPVEERSAASA